MILKYISISELNFSKSWGDGLYKIKNLNSFEKAMTIFWLLGPFIYLIERDPADLWLTVIAIFFLIRCIKNKDWDWMSQLWFKLALIFWFFSLFSGLTSTDPLFSFSQGFVWIRFPLYVAAAQVWLAKDRDIRVMMLLSMIMGVIIMVIILFSEAILANKHRLTWPYGDTTPGGYLAKFSLPAFCIMLAISVSRLKIQSIVLGLVCVLCFSATILTGERVNVLILICSGIIAGIAWKPRFKIYCMLILTQLLALLFVAYTNPDLKVRLGKNFLNHIPFIYSSAVSLDKNPYWGAWRGGIQQGLLTPVKGIGPSGTRKTCSKLDTNLPVWLPGKNYCGNHPHNFYIQLFAETGLIGLLIGCLMFFSIISTCYNARRKNVNCPMSSTAFIIPFAFFFPLQQFGSFYGQWGNLFTWFAIAFAVSQFQDWDKTKNDFQ